MASRVWIELALEDSAPRLPAQRHSALQQRAGGERAGEAARAREQRDDCAGQGDGGDGKQQRRSGSCLLSELPARFKLGCRDAEYGEDHDSRPANDAETDHGSNCTCSRHDATSTSCRASSVSYDLPVPRAAIRSAQPKADDGRDSPDGSGDDDKRRRRQAETTTGAADPGDDDARALVAAAYAAYAGFVQVAGEALRRGQASGEVVTTASPDVQAVLLLTVFQGSSPVSRAGIDRDQLDQSIDLLIDSLRRPVVS
jgi:hypothetical protein